MADLELTIASHVYDTTRALFDGSVPIDGVTPTMVSTATLPELFERLLSGGEFDAARYHREGRRLYGVPTMVPWMNALMERTLEQFGADWWPYGISANRTALETFLRYHHEQGLSRHRAVEELFAPELLDT